MSDSLIEKVVGGVLVARRYVSGNSLGREGTASEARQMVFNFRLDSSVTQNLTVSIISDLVLGGFSSTVFILGGFISTVFILGGF